MKKAIYNAVKLSEYRPLFHDKRVLVIGAGAVGSYLMEYLAKMGVSPEVIDFDEFTLENAAKNSCLVRTPDDAGRNKAVCVSERVQPLLDEGCTSNGIDGDLCKLGPEAFADYDVVLAAVDNYAAKVLLNELIRQLPKERRPVVIMDGTHFEMAQSVILDNSEFCLRCLMDESWLKHSEVRTSCTGPQIRQIDGKPEIVRTTNRASSMAAILSTEQFHGYVLGSDEVMNRRLTYTAYPHLELGTSHPMRKRNCPGCAIHPPKSIHWLPGNVMETTLKDALTRISESLGSSDFELSVYRLNYKNIVYGGFIVNSVCRSCGKTLHVLKHEGRVFPYDLLCEECSSSAIAGGHSSSEAEILHAFTNCCSQDIQDMTLYDLGYPLGAHIEVIQRNGALDYLDEGKIVKTVFAFKEDHEKIHHIHKL